MNIERGTKLYMAPEIILEGKLNTLVTILQTSRNNRR